MTDDNESTVRIGTSFCSETDKSGRKSNNTREFGLTVIEGYHANEQSKKKVS